MRKITKKEEKHIIMCFSSQHPSRIIEYAMTAFLENNMTKAGTIRKASKPLHIYIDGEETGWFIGLTDGYRISPNGRGYYSTRTVELQFYYGVEAFKKYEELL